VNYDTGGSPEYVDRQANRITSLRVHIEDRPRFEIENATFTTKIAGHGQTTLTIRNIGTQPVRDATVVVSSSSDELRFGTQSTTSRGFSSHWEPGEAREFKFATSMSQNVVRREYPLNAQVTYLDRDGVSQTSRGLTAGITPSAEQTFDIVNISSLLYVGEPGHIQGSIQNTGPTAVEDAALIYQSANQYIELTERESALGTLLPGESAQFSFDVRIDEEISVRRNQLNLSVRYREPTIDRHTSKQFHPTVDINPEREWLSVNPEHRIFGVDTENDFRVQVENIESQELSDIQAQLITHSPFDSESANAFIEELSPGEAKMMAFGLTVGEDAVPTQASVDLNIVATRSDGEEIHLDTYQISISVVEESTTSDTTLLTLGRLIAVILLVGGWWWMNR
jgi:hypothetical protein